MVHDLLVKEWLYKAGRDFSFSKFGLKAEKKYFDHVCFFLHQAAEKYLKAYIVKFDLKFEKEHDLVRLLKICEEKDSNFKELKPSCEALNPFYIESRYPDAVFVTFSKEEAEKGYSACLQIRNFVMKKLSISREITLKDIRKMDKKVDEILRNK